MRTTSLIMVFAAAAMQMLACRPQKAADEKGEHEPTSSQKSEEGDEEGDAGGTKVSRGENGNAVVSVSAETQARIGLRLQKLEKATRKKTLVAFGRLEQDPVATFTVRAPLAGFIVGDSSNPWPEIGQTIGAGTLIGHIRPRLGPVEMFDMRTRLASAHGEVEEVMADLEAARKSLASKQLLNKDQKVVSERTLEEAERDVKKGETRLSAAKETVKLLEDALGKGEGISVALPLTVERAGQVIQLDAEPGEAVESGQTILKVADQSRLIARIDLTTCPPSEVLSEPLGATIAVAGASEKKFAGKFIGGSTPADLMTSGRSFIFSMTDSANQLSPGLSVSAYMEMPGEAVTGVVVPQSAILRYAGSAWVYVQTAEEKFERMPVENAVPNDSGWFSVSLPAEKKVITDGAALLLSEELKSQIEAEEQGSE